MKKLCIAFALMMVASLALAQGHGGGHPGDMKGGPEMGRGPMGPAGEVFVDASGNAYVTVMTATGSSTTAPTFALESFSTAGTLRWKVSYAGGPLRIADGNLISVGHTAATTTAAPQSTITAISTASGATAWTLTLDGDAREIQPFSGGFYTIVVTPPATAGALPVQTLVGISNAGAVLFKTPVS